MSRLVDADVVTARLQDEADIVLNAADRCPLGSDERRSLIVRGDAYKHAIQVVKSAPIHLDVSHGVEPHTSGVGVAVSESDCREASAGTAPDLRSDTAESPAAAPPPGALEGVGAPASPDPTDFLEAQEVVSGALLKAHRLAVWRDEALPLLDQWLDLAYDARDAGLIHVPYGQSVTAAFARWARQHIEQQQGDQP